ncbi:hypothetical protein HYS94_01075 [Candidatus Daviesbacteria bacterium]|nr:hypothetical protein [Candidatus Daviesbacteria bacterium]
MNYLPFAILAYLLNGISVTISKFLLFKAIRNPLVYIFYISLVSLLAILLVPFTHIPRTEVIIISSISTLLWTSGAYFLFHALKIGQLSRVIPIVGTLIPLILLIFASLTLAITAKEGQAVLILIMGLILITLSDWRGDLSRKELIFELLSGLLFSLSYIFLRQAYLQDDFLTVLVWSRLILFPVGVAILLSPKLRAEIFIRGKKSFPLVSSIGLVFIVGQLTGGLSELLLLFSISLANPALVNSLQGTQFVFLFAANFFLNKKYPQIFKMDQSLLILLTKFAGVAVIALGLYLLAFS